MTEIRRSRQKLVTPSAVASGLGMIAIAAWAAGCTPVRDFLFDTAPPPEPTSEVDHADAAKAVPGDAGTPGERPDETPPVMSEPTSSDDAGVSGDAEDSRAGEPRSMEFRGEVTEIVVAGRYTYLRVQGETETSWVGMPSSGELGIEAGDHVLVPPGIILTDFYSRSLDRTFERVVLVDAVRPIESEVPAALPGPDDVLPQGHPPIR